MTTRRTLSPALAAVLAVTALVAGAWAQVPEDDPRVTPVVRAYRKAKPALVNISSKQVITTRGPFGMDPFEDIFLGPRRREVESLGSGFFIHPAGYVVTNAHVVRKASEITVTAADKTSRKARVIAADPLHDLAVLKVDLPEGATAPHLPLGRSDDLMIGETVLAVGNPLGYASTLTRGIISATGRKLEFARGVVMENLIQTDAPINPGNSGGPLLNIKGELIGINTAVRSDAQNIGFAIPVQTLAEQLPRLLDIERLRRVAFGVEVAQRRDKTGPYLAVTAVAADSPAAGQIEPGDLVISLDGRDVSRVERFACDVLEATADHEGPLRIVVSRDGRRREVALPLKAKPQPDGKLLAARLLGVKLLALNERRARQLRLSVASGLVVTAVADDSPADELGMKRGDVIFQVGRYYVRSLDEMGLVLEQVEPGETLRLGVVRGRIATWVQITADKPSTSTQPAEEPRQ